MGARKESYTENTIIFREGQKSKKMYIVLNGQVALYGNYGLENEYVIGVCSKGKTFGEMNLFSDEKCIYTAVAFSDVELAWFEKNNLESFINGFPSSAVQLFEKLAKSYTLLGKNLQMAFDEISSLENKIEELKKEKQEDAERPSSSKVLTEMLSGNKEYFEEMIPLPVHKEKSQMNGAFHYSMKK